MVFILFLFSRIAHIPIAITAITKMLAAQTMTSPGVNAIDAATSQQNRLFAIYVGVLIVTAVAGIVFTVLLWKSSNKVQDAIRDDALARIREADAVGKEAQAEAGKANQRAQELENANLSLSASVEILKGENLNLAAHVAALQKDAALAREQQAIAEMKLQELRALSGPRQIEFKIFLAEFKDAPKSSAEIVYQPDEANEAYDFAKQLSFWLGAGPGAEAKSPGVGWTIAGPRPISNDDIIEGHDFGDPKETLARKAGSWFGIGLVVKPPARPEDFPALAALMSALKKSSAHGAQAIVWNDSRIPADFIRIVIGPKYIPSPTAIFPKP